MHDNVPCHKSRKVTRYIERKQINILEWTGNSLNLNPIENFWHKMKNYVRTENNKPWKNERSAEKSLVPGDDSGIFQKFE